MIFKIEKEDLFREKEKLIWSNWILVPPKTKNMKRITLLAYQVQMESRMTYHMLLFMQKHSALLSSWQYLEIIFLINEFFINIIHKHNIKIAVYIL